MALGYALSGSNLVTFDLATPATPISSVAVTGLMAGQVLVGIDIRPANGLLYVLGVNATTNVGTLYTISAATGAATAVGSFTSLDLQASDYGFDFNPTVDRIRVTTADGGNLRINPNNGTLAGDDTNIVGAAISGAAYTNNQPVATVTTLYTLDSITDQLMIQNGNTGMQTAVGLLGFDFSNANGFDIAAGVNATTNNGIASGFGTALLTVGGLVGLYTINLATGAATLVGNFPGGAISGLTIQNEGVPFDFNGDRQGDILWQHNNGTPAVWLLNGTNLSVVGPALPNPGVTWHEKDAADFNADGKSDILWQNDNGTPAVWLMDGVNLLTAGPPLPNPGPTWHANEAADFNEDGRADILWQNDNGTPAVWLMDGVNVLSIGPALANPGPTWHQKDAADFNFDGKADILWQNDNGTPAVWLMNGTSVLSMGPPLPNPGPAWHAIASADFNADGKADILWQNDNGTPAVWLMDGTNLLTAGPPLANPGTSWHAKEAYDTNGDNKADIVWQNDNGTAAVWLMNGVNIQTIGAQLFNPGSDWHVI
jgi:hypothetical protein